jgi:hypothetical protein
MFRPTLEGDQHFKRKALQVLRVRVKTIVFKICFVKNNRIF